MKGRILGLALVLALGVVFLTRGAGPAPAPAVRPATPATGADENPSRVPPASAAPVSRDPFQYSHEGPAPAAGPRAARAPVVATPLAPSPSAAVRLVGLVRRGDRLAAAISVAGEVVVAGAGEDALGYAVLAVDEENGVRLRDSAGAEITLPPS